MSQNDRIKYSIQRAAQVLVNRPLPEGIFRLTQAKNIVDDAKTRIQTPIEYQNGYDFLHQLDTLTIASLLKHQLGQLQPRIFERNLLNQLQQAEQKQEHEKVAELVGQCNHPEILRFLICELIPELLKHESVTRMNSYALATVLAPNICRPIDMCGSGLNGDPKLDASFFDYLICHRGTIPFFGGTLIQKAEAQKVDGEDRKIRVMNRKAVLDDLKKQLDRADSRIEALQTRLDTHQKICIDK